MLKKFNLFIIIKKTINFLFVFLCETFVFLCGKKILTQRRKVEDAKGALMTAD